MSQGQSQDSARQASVTEIIKGEQLEISVVMGLMLLLGIWQIISPWFYGYSKFGGIDFWVDEATGVVIVVVAIVAFFNWFGFGLNQWSGWILAIAGLILFFWPVILQFEAPLSRATDMILGMSVFAFGVLAALTARGMVSASRH